MDQATNRLWDLLPAGNYFGRVFRRLFLSHRTLSHSILGVYLIFKLLEWVLPKLLNPVYIDVGMVFWAIMIGYFSHLVADSLTKDGLPLLFPLKLKFGIPPLSALRITTGSWVENFLILPAIAVYLIWFIGRNKTQLLEIIRLIGS